MKKGSLLENRIKPTVGMKAWVVIYNKIHCGKISRVNNIDNRGLANTYIELDNGSRANTAQTFDHKPEQVVIEDCFGKVTVWQ